MRFTLFPRALNSDLYNENRSHFVSVDKQFTIAASSAWNILSTKMTEIPYFSYEKNKTMFALIYFDMGT